MVQISWLHRYVSHQHIQLAQTIVRIFVGGILRSIGSQPLVEIHLHNAALQAEQCKSLHGPISVKFITLTPVHMIRDETEPWECHSLHGRWLTVACRFKKNAISPSENLHIVSLMHKYADAYIKPTWVHSRN